MDKNEQPNLVLKEEPDLTYKRVTYVSAGWNASTIYDLADSPAGVKLRVEGIRLHIPEGDSNASD